LENNTNENKRKNPVKVAGRGVVKYLSDWRNWLTHGLVGIGLLLLAILAPVKVWIKIIVMLCVIAFNCVRMSLKKKKKAAAGE